MSIISKDLEKAISLLQNEELVAIPTETVYGLAGNIFSEKAIRSIFATKERPFFNPLIVHIPHADALNAVVAQVPEKAKLLAHTFWPGPLTLVLKKKASVPDLITAGKETVAVRIPDHPLTLQLLQSLDFPLAAPSANPFGSISPTTAEHVERYFGSKIKMVLDGGPCQKGIESTIVGFEGEQPVVYRLGSVSIEDIEDLIGNVRLTTHNEVLPQAPGMLERHYAPSTKTIISENIEEDLKQFHSLNVGILLYTDRIINSPVKSKFILSSSGDINEAARNLYASLHLLDRQNLDMIVIEKLPDNSIGRALNDRIKRATK
jgi:L-threonylcarbamoyladenylate synthase